MNDASKASNKDRIYRSDHGQLVDFAFDQRVVDVFPDMIRRSVPAYETVVPLSALLAARHARPDTAVYDLGCSRGATSAALAAYCPEGSRIIALDNSEAMVGAAREALSDTPVEVRFADITEEPFEPASAVVMNYTLQFVTPPERAPLLQRILGALLPGAPLIYAEKIVLDDPQDEAYFNAVHLDFKRANGYSELEVAQKRTALERVMQPDSLQQHLDRLQALGFRRAGSWFRCLNWAAFIGFKDGSAPMP